MIGINLGLKAFHAEAADPKPSAQEGHSSRIIYLVEMDEFQAQDLTAQIGYFGYTAQTFNHLNDLSEALQSSRPAAILMDVAFSSSEQILEETIQTFQNGPAGSIPIVFVSMNDNITTRLHAVRFGGEAYFTKPVDVGAVIDVLDRLIAGKSSIPYRILIVDDSRVQANINAMHLKKAGMETEIVTEPLKILGPLVDFNPDLILLDMYMPECTGMELARVIRQMEAYISIPIVYLSAETDREKQLEAVGLGGDDFLTKPIKPGHLIGAVTSRVERYRQLRALMLRDSLTGLFNHTTTKERLGHEVSRAGRQNSSLAYAMLDLDNFKQVNDCYGHASGDRVLKSLARLLTRRLRGTDIIGRYGGEELAIIFPHTTGPAAAQIMDEIRVSFANIHHHTGESEFTVTFSCGVACFPEYKFPVSLGEAADRALYVAKKQGRNQVFYQLG